MEKKVRILEYRNPQSSTSSGNIGDYVQTYAVALLALRWIRIWSRIRKPQEAPAVCLASRDDTPPANGGLTVRYGWHMHPGKDGTYNFPPPSWREEEEILIAFHVSKSALVTHEGAVAYLHSRSPVGCRDLETLRMLRSVGVPSFYSGCSTATLPCRKKIVKNGAPLAVEVPRLHKEEVALKMWDVSYRQCHPKLGLLHALFRLRLFATAAHVRTSRLHAFYPCIAMGTTVSVSAPDGGETRTDWGAPGRWGTARRYIRDPSEFLSRARRFERVFALTLLDYLDGRPAQESWRRWATVSVAVTGEDQAMMSSCLEGLSGSDMALDVILAGYRSDVMASLGRCVEKFKEENPGQQCVTFRSSLENICTDLASVAKGASCILLPEHTELPLDCDISAFQLESSTGRRKGPPPADILSVPLLLHLCDQKVVGYEALSFAKGSGLSAASVPVS